MRRMLLLFAGLCLPLYLIGCAGTTSITRTITVSVNPTMASVPVGQTQQFTATVTGTTNTAVSWSVVGGATNGTVNSSGLYTAPSAVPSPPQVTVTATSAADPTKSASATVTITQNVVVQVSPLTASVLIGQTQQFTATVTGTTNTGVTWSVVGGATNGTINSSGLYTAPSAVPSPPQVTVTATSAADPAKSASATVSITQNVVVQVSPSTASVLVGQTQPFTATVTGTTNTAVTWSVAGGAANGTISATGLYTAPSAVPSPAQVTVMATSVADPTKSGSATVTVTQGVGVSVSPTTATVVVAQTQPFTATVTGAANTNVTWTLTQGGAACPPTTCGTITPASTASGTPATYTAPATVPAIPNVTVTATSVADTTKSASAIVTVTTQTTGVVAVSPATATVEVFTTQQFTVTINGQPSTAVTWQVQLPPPSSTPLTGAIGGSVSASGLYTAPHSISNTLIQAHPNGAPLTVEIVATSTANTANSGSATVTLTVPGRSAESAPLELGTSGSNALDFNTNGGSTTCCGGTLAALLANGSTQYILSADHVLARSGAGAPGEAILQPGLIDTNCSSQGTQTVANLTQGSINSTNTAATTVDAAIAQVAAGTVDSTGKILMLGNAVDATGVPVPGAPQAGPGQAASVGLAVAKSGRTTGLTCSTVLATNLSTRVQYSTNCDGTGTIFFVTYTNQVDVTGGDFSSAGDSGSLIVTQSDATPVALLFADSSTDTVGNPISDVLSYFASNGHPVSFVGGNRGPGSTPQVIGCTLPAPAAAAAAQLALQKVVPSKDALALAATVRDTHAAELMVHPEVQAVGVGASYDNPSEAAILLFVTKGQPRTNLPAVLDGVRTRIIEGEPFSRHGVLSPEESAGLAQFAAPPQAVYAISDAEMARAKVVHQAHVDELMKMPGVQGVGITSSVDSPGESALMIFLIDGVAHPAIPPEIDGVRTRIRVSSRFHAGLDGNGPPGGCRVPRPKSKQPSPRPNRASGKN